MSPHVTFVCVRNRVRSTFAEFYLADVFRKGGDRATVSSAGFVPQVLKDQLAEALIPFPEPLFNKIFSIREMSEKKGYLFSEDFSALPLDQKYWYYAEEDPGYVSKTLQEWEETLTRAIPNITKRLGMGERD